MIIPRDMEVWHITSGLFLASFDFFSFGLCVIFFFFLNLSPDGAWEEAQSSKLFYLNDTKKLHVLYPRQRP